MKAFFAGSFDPFTIGHLSIVERALKIFPEVIVAIGTNESKKPEWSLETREASIRKLFEGNKAVSVTLYNGLTCEAAHAAGAGVIIRGIRNSTDFDYEKTLADANRKIGGMETVFIPAEPELSFISSSLVRELLHHGKNPASLIAGVLPIP